jgi:hypothetical protein
MLIILVISLTLTIFICSISQTTPIEFDVNVKHLPAIKTNNRILQDNPGYDLLRPNQTVYQINLNIGSPSQSFQLMLDTGSFVTWVASIGSFGHLSNRTQYHPNESKYYVSANESKNITYAASEVSGYVFNDVITFDNNTNTKTIKLVAVENAYPDIEVAYDGIISLCGVFQNH